MATGQFRTKVVVVGRRVVVHIRGFDLNSTGQIDYGTHNDRILIGRVERIEQAITFQTDEVSAMDEVQEHTERIKSGWTLTTTEIKHLLNPYDSLPLPTLDVTDWTGTPDVSYYGMDALDDALFGNSHAAIAFETGRTKDNSGQGRLKVFFGAIIGGDETLDRNSGRNTLRIASISLGSRNQNFIPNPIIAPVGTPIPW